MDASAAVHPTDQTLRSYGLGKLDDALAESLNKHLEGCADCRRRVTELTSDSSLDPMRDARGRPGTTGPIVSSLTGLSMLEGGPSIKAPPPTDTLPPGLANHPDYEVVRELGQGGMGTVYLALNRLMDRHEVLKVVSSHLMNRVGALDRFLGEIRHAARLHHTNVVTAYSATRIGESVVFAMEYVEGLDLSRLVKSKGPLPVANACYYVHQAAMGLQHAHEHGMVHRDIKPSNLMLARQGNHALIKVLDFGLAKVRSEGAVDSGLTHEGQMLGTPDYIAPEQISNARRADIRADIYSLGCTLYYLLTGGPPFRGECLYDILQAHHSMEAMPLNLKRPEVPVELAALVAKMMAKEPERRFREPKDVAQALAPFFKKGELAFKSPEVEVSQPGRSGSGRPVPELVSMPAQPATIDARPIAQEQRVARTSASEPEWNRLIDQREAERIRKGTPAIAPMWRPRWLGPSVAVGVLLLALFVAWALVVRVKTSNGIIELVNLPRDAEVFIDGQEVAVTLPGGGKPAIISVTAGKHEISVKKDGLELSGAELTVRAEGKEALIVRLVPPAASPAGKRKADDRLDRSEEVGEIPREDSPNLPLEAVDKRGASDGVVEHPAASPMVEREMATVGGPSLAKTPVLPPVLGTTTSRGKFQRLFNGKDLTGWKTHPKQKGHWHVANGVLIGYGPSISHLYTERDDFTDFHLRVEARFNKGGAGGVYFRCPFGPSLPTDDPKRLDGYVAMINNSRIERNSTGGLYPGKGNEMFLASLGEITRLPFGQWFTLDVIADGEAIAILVNGKTSAYHVDRGRRGYSSGHIALQQYSPETVIEFRKVEIKELNRSNQKSSKELGPFLSTMGRVNRVAFLPDGLGILSGGHSNEFVRRTGGINWTYSLSYTIQLREVASGRKLFTMGGGGWAVRALAVSSDGRHVASSGGSLHEQPILIWDLNTGKRIHRFPKVNSIDEMPCTTLSFSPDDRRVMAALANGTVLVWDLETEQEQPPTALKAGPIKLHEFPGAAFTSDRRHLITGRQTGPVELWDLQTGRRLQSFAGHTGVVRSVAGSADGRLILSAGSDNTLRLWSVASGKELRQFVSDDRVVRCVAFSPDSRRALSAGLDGPVHLWDLANGKEVCRMEGHSMSVNSVAFSPDGRRAVSGSDDRTVRLWQLPE